MSRKRHFIVLTAAMATVAWAAACGDGGTEPPAPLPDPPRATTVTVTPATAELTALGATEQLTAEVRDQNGQVMAGAAVTWASSSAAVATVSAAGLVTAVANGTATITATAGAASGSATVTVAQEVSAVAVTPAADTLVAGDTLRLTAEAADANGHTVGGAEFTWASSDTLVAVVDDSGLVTGVGAGEAEIAATASSVRGRAEIAVLEPSPTTVAVKPDTLALTAVGQTAQLTAEVRDQAGRVMAGVPVSWSSADATVAAVDSAGLVTAAGSGTTTITASAGSASGEAFVTVMQSAGSIVVSPPTVTIALSDTLRLVAEAFDENGHAVEGAEFTWSSSNAAVATVNASGLVRSVAEGAATITATSGSAAGSSEITVESPDRAALLALYEAAAGGRGWANRDNWLTDAPLAEWHGIETDRVGRVVSLDLGENGLAGRIPVEIGDLAALERFVLTDNQLTGPIPSEIGGLSNLTELLLAGNSLEGAIPSEVGKLAKLESLELARNQMTGQIPAELGDLSNLERLWLGSNFMKGPLPPELGNLAGLGDLRLSNMGLTGPIPPELGNLSRLRRLDLFQNALTGPVPTELGSLSLLWVVQLTGNQLTGALPASLTRLTGLGHLNYGRNAGLCAPGSAGFVEWTRGLEGLDGPFCNRADREGLGALHGAAGGDGWTNSEGWLGDRAVGAWHGVAADSLGRVTGIELADNGLAGELPAAIGDLARMTVLKLDGNDLSGRLPMSLARVPLREFRYAETELCAPPAAAFRAWLDGIASHEGTGVECPELPDREILAALYEAADGPNWTGSENWLTDAPLEDWHGVHADNEGRVTGLVLRENGLSDRIPPELGELQHLTRLDLSGNGLEGPVPSELGGLSGLRRLNLSDNRLTASIPPELGALSGLEELLLIENGLTGPIPRELGNLSALRSLLIANNSLGGSIPSELGRLSNLEYLWLGNNLLTGRIPPELGNLSSLVSMWLGDNLLIGRIPPELGNLTNLRFLRLGDRFPLQGLGPEGRRHRERRREVPNPVRSDPAGARQPHPLEGVACGRSLPDGCDPTGARPACGTGGIPRGRQLPDRSDSGGTGGPHPPRTPFPHAQPAHRAGPPGAGATSPVWFDSASTTTRSPAYSRPNSAGLPPSSGWNSASTGWRARCPRRSADSPASRRCACRATPACPAPFLTA